MRGREGKGRKGRESISRSFCLYGRYSVRCAEYHIHLYVGFYCFCCYVHVWQYRCHWFIAVPHGTITAIAEYVSNGSVTHYHCLLYFHGVDALLCLLFAKRWPHSPLLFAAILCPHLVHAVLHSLRQRVVLQVLQVCHGSGRGLMLTATMKIRVSITFFATPSSCLTLACAQTRCPCLPASRQIGRAADIWMPGWLYAPLAIPPPFCRGHRFSC